MVSFAEAVFVEADFAGAMGRVPQVKFTASHARSGRRPSRGRLPANRQEDTIYQLLLAGSKNRQGGAHGPRAVPAGLSPILISQRSTKPTSLGLPGVHDEGIAA